MKYALAFISLIGWLVSATALTFLIDLMLRLHTNMPGNMVVLFSIPLGCILGGIFTSIWLSEWTHEDYRL